MNVFPASIEAMLKLYLSVRLKMIMGPLLLVETFSVAKFSVTYAEFLFIGLGLGKLFSEALWFSCILLSLSLL